MTPLRAQLWNPPNAKPDLGQVHGIDIRTGERRIARQAPAKAVQKASAPPPPPPRVAVNIYPATFAMHDRIIKTVCHVFEVRLNELLSERRNVWVAEARHAAMSLIVRLTKHSTPKVGRLFGRDHTTVLYAVRKMQPHMDAIEAHMPPDSIMEWVTALKERLTDESVVEARRIRHGGKTHCINGHALDEENTGHRNDGKRFCRTCVKQRDAMRYQAKKLARLK